jgi:hypothetical protein
MTSSSTIRRRRSILAWVVALASVLAALFIGATTAPVPRELSTLVIVAGPGLAWVPLLELDDLALEALLCLICSVTAVIIVAQVVTYAVAFSWRPCEFSLLAITLLGLIIQSVIAQRREGDRR